MVKINIKLKNKGEKVENSKEIFQMELFPLFSSDSEIMGILSQIRICELRIEKEALMKKVKSQTLSIDKMTKENNDLTFANGRMATASIQLDEENKRLKAELDRLTSQNVAYKNKIEAIKNMVR